MLPWWSRASRRIGWNHVCGSRSGAVVSRWHWATSYSPLSSALVQLATIETNRRVFLESLPPVPAGGRDRGRHGQCPRPLRFPPLPKAMSKGECPLRLRLHSGAALHPRMKDAECCAGATLIGEATAQADPQPVPNTGRTVRYRLDSQRRDPEAHCCKNVTPLTGVRGLASAPERNRRFRIQSVERVSKWEWGCSPRSSALAGLRAAKGQRGEPDHGSSTTETPNRVDRRGRRGAAQPDCGAARGATRHYRM